MIETVPKSADVAGGAFAERLGIEVLEVGDGRASMRLTVEADMLNGADVVHGAVVFALADTCFGAAAWTRNPNSLAGNAEIAWLRAARAGDVLTARAEEAVVAGRTGIYDITVTDQTGAPVAVFRGTARARRPEAGAGLPAGGGSAA